MRGGDGLLFDCLSGYCGGEVGFEVVSWLREWRRDQRRAGVDTNACCKVVKRRDQVKILVAEVRRISSRGRIHLKSVNERANRGIAGTEGLNGGRRHACAAGSGKQASTSTHTSQTHASSSILLTDLSHHIQQGKQGCRMVLPRFLRFLYLDWLEGELCSVRGRERDRWRS